MSTRVFENGKTLTGRPLASEKRYTSPSAPYTKSSREDEGSSS